MAKALYQLILLKNNECVKVYSSHSNKKNVIIKYNKMLFDNKSVVFPIQNLNYEKIESVKYYLAIITREHIGTTPKLKNEYGEYVDHVIVDNDEWVMMMKDDYNFEESFWVYGYHPTYYRKDFNFIYEEFINKYKNQKYEFMNVWQYKNKVVVETSKQTNMVICKNVDDASRMYFLLNEYSEKNKVKNIIFSGNWGLKRNFQTKAIDKIQLLTNWTRKKISRNTT